MALHKAFAWMLSILILTLVMISLSFVESSSSCLPCATTMVANRASSTAPSTKVRKYGEACVGAVVESAREVPTGPDPLHDNKNPTGP